MGCNVACFFIFCHTLTAVLCLTPKCQSPKLGVLSDVCGAVLFDSDINIRCPRMSRPFGNRLNDFWLVFILFIYFCSRANGEPVVCEE